MLEIICLILLGLTLLLMCLFVFAEGKLSKKFGYKALCFIAILFVVFSLAFKPESFIRWDLIEHFKIIDKMRAGGFNYAVSESQYADLVVYNYFAYFISLFPSPQFCGIAHHVCSVVVIENGEFVGCEDVWLVDCIVWNDGVIVIAPRQAVLVNGFRL